MFAPSYIMKITLLFILMLTLCKGDENTESLDEKRSIIVELERSLQFKFAEYANVIARWLERFNDKHLASSEFGRWLHYEDIKPKLTEIGDKSSRSMKKMSMAILPLIFHIGATSTWMIVTALMAAKSVAIGMLLLIFKIAVSSAKVASFFTVLKQKHHEHSWTPHYEHYGHERSFSDSNISNDNEHHHEHHHDHHEDEHEHHGHHEHEWQSYHPEWTPNELSPHEYQTIPSSYKSIDGSHGVVEAYSDFSDSSKKRIG